MTLAPARRASMLAALVAVWIGAACGGNVVVDQPGGSTTTVVTTGAATASTTITDTTFSGTTVTFSTSSGGVECSGTFALLASDVANAEQCKPGINVVECSGKTIAYDACGCPHVANDLQPQLANSANGEYMNCVAMGCCGPGAHPINPPSCPPCAMPLMPYCDPMTFKCSGG